MFFRVVGHSFTTDC